MGHVASLRSLLLAAVVSSLPPLACSSEPEPATTSGSSSASSSGAGGDATSSSHSSSSAGGGEPTPIAGTLEETASSIALGPADVYWASYSILGDGGYESGVKKAPKEPGDASYEIEVVWPIAVGVDSTHVYWADGFSISKKPLGSGDVATIATDQELQPGASIVVDDTSVYWPNRDLGTVMKGAKDGSGAVVIATAQMLPTRVAVDDTAVYWTNTAQLGAVVSAPKDGSAIVTVIAADQPFPSALTVDDTHVYWTNVGNMTVMKVPKVGGVPVVVASSQFSTSIAVDATDVYWLASDQGVVRTPLAGGGTTTEMSVGQTGCSELALDDTHVYWTRNVYGEGAKVLKLPK
jgi:hypothetical protein